MIVLAFLMSPTRAFSENMASYQQKFVSGVQWMGTDPSRAAEIFQSLYNETGAPRVQLELARSLYLAGQLNQAKEQFIDVLNKPIPITVRDKVEWYLNQIQMQQSVKVTLGVFQDTNPGQITAERSFNVFGQLLDYQPATATGSQMALNLSAQAERELSKGSGYFAKASVSTLTYESKEYNKQLFDLALAKRWQDIDYKELQFGNQVMMYGDKFLYNMPYISTSLVFNRDNQDYYGVSAQAGVLDYPDYDYLDGPQFQGRIFYNHNINNNLTAFFEIGADRTIAKESPYSSTGAYFSLGTQIAHDPTSLQLNVLATISKRGFSGDDPFWGTQRQDVGKSFNVSLTKRNFYILGFTPVLEFNYQTNHSNNNFFSYNKTFVGLFFKNVY